jgi:hypothetical protein
MGRGFDGIHGLYRISDGCRLILATAGPNQCVQNMSLMSVVTNTWLHLLLGSSPGLLGSICGWETVVVPFLSFIT